MTPKNKLVAYRPFLATHTAFGIATEQTPKGKWLVRFKDGTIKELEQKEFTIVWDKRHPDFIDW